MKTTTSHRYTVQNRLTGLYFVAGKGFVGTFAQASRITETELAMVRYVYDPTHMAVCLVSTLG